MPSMSNLVIVAAVAYGLTQTVFKKSPKDKNPAEAVKKTAASAAERVPKPPQVVNSLSATLTLPCNLPSRRSLYSLLQHSWQVHAWSLLLSHSTIRPLLPCSVGG